MPRRLVVTTLGACLSLWAGCVFDPILELTPPDAASRDAGAKDALSGEDVLRDGRAPDTGPPLVDAAPDRSPLCTEGTFQCPTDADGHARVCVNGTWQDVGRCFLGCDVGSRRCREPSNLDTSSLNFQEQELSDLRLSSSHHYDVDTSNGSIVGDDSTEVRPANNMNSVANGIGFYVVHQAHGPDLGVFVARSLWIEDGATVDATGRRALVILVTGDATVAGTLDAGAHGPQGGPGGYAGGSPGMPGGGPCPGQPGLALDGCPDLCDSGSGGGGFGGRGGPGGPVADSSGTGECVLGGPSFSASGAPGGGPCGNEELTPLIGGSGGAGAVPGHTTSTDPGYAPEPGPGGGGGGAVQISARGRILVSGIITVPGDGGGRTVSGGGAGGGAGGAILLEAGTVVCEADAYLAANGGGGGGGDCT